jgi:hypothetical protein
VAQTPAPHPTLWVGATIPGAGWREWTLQPRGGWYVLPVAALRALCPDVARWQRGVRFTVSRVVACRVERRVGTWVAFVVEEIGAV